MIGRLIATALFLAFYVAGNLGGNYAGWLAIFRWIEEANGEKTIAALWLSMPVLILLSVVPSVGQWWREWFNVQDKYKWAVYVVMAADVAINTIGFYDLMMGNFAFPPVWSVFIFLMFLALIPNVLCQSIATVNLKALLQGEEKTPAKKAKERLQADAKPIARKSNGAIPVQVEELQL